MLLELSVDIALRIRAEKQAPYQSRSKARKTSFLMKSRFYDLPRQGSLRRIHDCLSTGVEMSTLVRTSNFRFFHQRANRVDRGHAADDSVRIRAKSESKDREFHRDFLKLVGVEPNSIMPNRIVKPRQRTFACHGNRRAESSRFSNESATNV